MSEKPSHEIKVKFDISVPDEIRGMLMERMGPYLPLLKREIRLLHVMLKGASSNVEGEAATMSARRYHTSAIAFDPSFFELDAEEQERTAAHEMVHVLHNLFSLEVFNVVEQFAPDEMKPYLQARLEEAEERVVDTLGDALYDLIHGG